MSEPPRILCRSRWGRGAQAHKRHPLQRGHSWAAAHRSAVVKIPRQSRGLWEREPLKAAECGPLTSGSIVAFGHLALLSAFASLHPLCAIALNRTVEIGAKRLGSHVESSA